jgi:Sulfatase
LLPSGRSYYFSELTEGLLYPGGFWTDNTALVDQGYQRHLLQVGYADSLVGRLLRQLERKGLYDRALVVVVADHGASFRAGVSRRSVSRETFADIASVPLIVKYPHQRRGGQDRRPARTVDVLPTVADVLGIQLPWRADGRSLRGTPPAPTGEIVLSGTDRTVRASTIRVVRDVEAAVDRKSDLFGGGSDSLYRIGDHKELLGARVSANVPRSTTTRVQIQGAELFTDVRMESSVVPARVAGLVVAGEVARDAELAIALNGRVVALAKCFRAAGGQLFRVLVPESALREGYNRVDVFAIEEGRRKASLVWLGASADP